MKKKNRLLRIVFILAFLVSLGLGNELWAAARTAAASGNWSNTATWGGAAVPTSADDVTIPDTYTVTVDAAAVCKSLTFSGTSQLTNTAGITVSGNITAIATTTIGGAGSISVDATSAINVASTTTLPNLTVASGITATITTNPLTITGALVVNGTLATAALDLTVGGATTIGASGLISGTTGTKTFTGAVTNNGTTKTTHGITMTSTAVVVFDNTMSGTAYDLATTTVNLTGGTSRTLPAGLACTVFGVPSGDKTITVASGTSFTVTGALTSVANTALDLSGATVSISSATNFANITTTTDASTNLTITYNTTSPLALPAGITTLNKLTINAANALTVTAGANLTLSDDLTLAGVNPATLDMDAYNLTVNGDLLIQDAGAHVLTLDGTNTYTFNGAITFPTTTTGHATANLVIGGTGAITGSLSTGAWNNVTMNRSGQTLTFGAAGAIGGDLTISAGTVVSGDYAFAAAGNVSIASGATLTLTPPVALARTASLATGAAKILSGSGIINMDGGAGVLYRTVTIGSATSGGYTFTGTINTNANSGLTIISTQTADINLPSSIDELLYLGISRGSISKRVVLGGDLTLNRTTGQTATEFVAGDLVVGANTLTVNKVYSHPTTIAAFRLDLRNGSTLVLKDLTGSGADWGATTNITTDATSSISFTGVYGAHAVTNFNVSVLKDLTLNVTGATLSLAQSAASLDIYGNLTLTNATDVFTKLNTGTLTVRGNVVAGLGTLTLTGGTGAVKLYGTMTGSAIAGDAGTLLEVLGTAAQLALPSSITNLEKITLNRPAGMILAGNLGLGGGSATDLDIISGNLDLNGNNITLASVADKISETNGNTIVNTGTADATHGYVTTASGTYDQIIASGIGLTAADGAHTLSAITVRRYPVASTLTAGASVKRKYLVTATGSASTLTFKYDGTELNSNDPAGLSTYYVNDYAMTGALAGTNSVNTSGTITSTLNFASPLYYTFGSAAVVAGGTTKTYTGGGAANTWNDANNWTPSGIPTAGDPVLIPAGVTLTNIPVNISASSLTIETGSKISLGAGAGLTVAGNLTINSDQASAFAMAAGATLTVNGDLNVTGTGNVYLTDGTTTAGNYEYVTINGTINKTGTGTIYTSGGATYGTYLTFTGTTASVTIPSEITSLHTLRINKAAGTVYQNSNLTVAGSATLDVLAGTYIVGNNNLTVTGATNVAAGAVLDASYTSPTVTRIFNGAVAITGNGAINLSGPQISTAAAYNVEFNGAVTLDAGTLNLTNSKVKVAAAMSGASTWTLTANGTSITANAAINFANGTFQTNQHTDLTFTSAPLNFPSTVNQLNNLTSSVALILTGDLELTGNLTQSASTLTYTNRTLTVNGTLNATGGILDGAGSTLIVNGPVAAGYWGTINNSNTLDLTIGGSGTLVVLPNNTVFADVTMNRPNQTLQFAGATTTLNSLTITNGTVKLPVTGGSTITATTVVGANGTLDANTTGAQTLTFGTGLSGSGKMILTGTGVQYLTVDFGAGCVYAYSNTGNMVTNASTIFDINSSANTNMDLPSSVLALRDLQIATTDVAKTVTLNSDLTIDAAITGFATGTLVLNGKTITFGAAYGQAAAGSFIMNATGSSSIVFTGVPTFVAGGITADETTNMTFVAGADIPVSITKLNNLTAKTAGNTVLFGALELYGNLSVLSGATFNASTFSLTVNGNVSNAGTLLWNGGTGTITLKGSLNNTNTLTVGANTRLNIAGSSEQFIMPTSVATLGTLTLDRSSGLKLNNALRVGIVGTNSLVLSKGDLDLNGNVITLDNSTTYIVEAAGATVINTGATGINNGYIITAALGSNTNAVASGIGIVAIEPTANYTVRRYPTTTPISGVGLSVGRLYYISNALPTSVTLQYDNTEVYSNAAGMRLYTSAGLAFGTYTDQTNDDGANRAVNQNTPAGKGNVAYSEFKTAPAAGAYYTMAATPGTGGILYSAVRAGDWDNSSTWSPSGIPTKDDQVFVGPYTVTLKGNGADYYAQSIVMNQNSAKLVAKNGVTSGDNVTLNVMGNITITNGASIDAINGTGRLNITIGDGVTQGVGSTITAAAAYVIDNGLSVNNLTLKSASASGPNSFMRVYGNIAMEGNSALSFTGAEVEMYGGSNAVQTITVPSSASFSLNDLRVTNSANVTSTADFAIAGKIQVDPFANLVASNGTVTFPTNTQTGWAVQQDATLRLYNVEIGNSAGGIFTPSGTIEIAGNFTKTGANTFAITNPNTVVFKNSGQKELVHASTNATLLNFYNLTLAPNASVKTSSSFDIVGNIDVQQDATFLADNGTITIDDNTVSSRISNTSNRTLVFFNLKIADDVLTSDSWKIAGNLEVSTNSLVADNGTVTFENVSEKSIRNVPGTAGALKFFGLKVADGSKVKTSTVEAEGNFTIANNATNMSGAGLFVEGTGQFTVSNIASILYFGADVGVSGGYPKTITKSTNGTITLGTLQINAANNNEVTTASDFTVAGIGTAFNTAGAGAKFTATAGTVKFTGATPFISTVAPAVTTFYNLLTEGTTNLTVTTDHEIYVNGNITVDGTSQINPQSNTAKVNITGTADQTIGGTSSIVNAVEFGRLTINKANGSQVLMNTDVEISSHADAQLVLTNGILNLGSKKLTVGAGVISRLNGAINGATGTYVINTAHQNNKLEDAYFTVNSIPTLYNLTVSTLHTTANDLTVNGTLNLNTGAFGIAAGTTSLAAAKRLILNGNLSRTAGTITSASTADLSVLVLQGDGIVSGGLQNNFFSGTYPSIVMARQETLGGNLTMGANANLTINTGTKNFDLGTRTLTLDFDGGITRISGSITAGLSSTVNFSTILRVPANLFTNNQVGNFTSTANGLTLDGDLAIMTSLNFPNNKHIYTGENTLTFGPSLTFANPMTSANHVKGNLVRTVNANTLLEFPIGTGTSTNFTPVSLKLETSGNTQLIKASALELDPTTGRGGNSKNAVNITYNLAPVGAVVNDNVQVKFQYTNPTIYEQTTPVANGAFPAKWNGLGWTDYRSNLAAFTVTIPRVVTMSGYPVALNNLAGIWGIFTVDVNSNDAKDKAISMTANRVVITKIDPSPVKKGQAFKANIQLQDMNGQPITAASAFTVRLQTEYGTSLDGTTIDAIIPAGASMTTVAGLVMSTASTNNLLKADTVGGSTNWQPSLSAPFAVIDAAPAVQASNITFSNVKETSMTVTWNNGSGASQNTIIIAKAESLLEDSEFPVNANTYIANGNFGSGSSIGNATVIYNASAANGSNSIQVTGLSPNTNYYFYALAYSGNEGYENYKLTAATKNPNAQKTTGTSDDDVSLGTNNTSANSKPIGTNTPVTGTIGSATDEDWFNFSVTNATPNVRVQMYGLANNYNVEVYDMAGRRIRRGIRTATGSEGPVVNDLPAGTYTVRIYSADGSYSTTNTYTLKVGTKSSEIFSVTP